MIPSRHDDPAFPDTTSPEGTTWQSWAGVSNSRSAPPHTPMDMNKLSKAPTSDDRFRYVDRSFDSDLLSLPLPRVMMQGTYEPSAMALGAALIFRWDLIAASTRFRIAFGSWSSRCFCQLQVLLV